VVDWQPRLTGRLLALRPVEASDFDALYAQGRDPEVWAIHPARDRWRPEVFRAYFEGGLAAKTALAAVDLASGEVIGWSRYSDKNMGPDEIEIGWTFLGRPYWGGAYNGEMKRLMLGHAFRFVERVLLSIGETNLRSRRAAEKIGARLLADRPAPPPAGHDAPHVYYAIEKADFLAVHGPLDGQA
jgi:RimJ/RimL family protein N-acetyltransferase